MNDRNIFVENWHNYKGNKQQILNNCVEPMVGEAIFNTAMDIHINTTNHNQILLF
jgi:hypothetical protein